MRMKKRKLARVKTAEVVRGFLVRLTFSDGVIREVDLEQYLRGPVFEELHIEERFRELQVDQELGTIVWPNGADIDPDVLYGREIPEWMIDTRTSKG